MNEKGMSGSGFETEIEVSLCGERCEECGEVLGSSSMAIYDGDNWRRVHSFCAAVE